MSARARFVVFASVASLGTALVACSNDPLAGATATDGGTDASSADAPLDLGAPEAIAETIGETLDAGDPLLGDYVGVIAGSGGVGGAIALTVSAAAGPGVPDGVAGIMDLPTLGGLLPISGALHEDTLTLSLDATSPSGEIVCDGPIEGGPIYVLSCKRGVATFSAVVALASATPTELCGTLSATGSATPLGAFDLLVVGASAYAIYGTTDATISSGALAGTVTPAVASPVAHAHFPWGTGAADVDLAVPSPTSGSGTWSEGTSTGTFEVSTTACPSTAPPDAGSEVGADGST